MILHERRLAEDEGGGEVLKTGDEYAMTSFEGTIWWVLANEMLGYQKSSEMSQGSADGSTGL